MSNILNRNNVNIIGSGDKVMLFAHGFGCDQNSWNFVVNAFSDEYKLVLFDYVGAGQSDLKAYDPQRYSSLDGYAQDILDICHELDLKEIIFVGHSVSSMIGVIAALKEPELFKNLIFIGPSARYINDENYVGGFERKDIEALLESMDSNYLGWSSALAPAIMGNTDQPQFGEFLTKSFCATDPDIAREFAKVTFLSDNREDLKKLSIKSLTLQCQQDIIAPISVGEYIRDITPGNSMVMMKATGHCPHISAPQETIEAIKAYL